MKSIGNIASNKIYNPRNIRPTIPLDPDEVDTSVEKYIREKYQRRTLSDIATIARNNSHRRSCDGDGLGEHLTLYEY